MMRARLVVVLAVLLVCAFAADAQIIHPTSGTSNQAVSGGEVYYDSGGAGGNYSNSESGVTSFCAAGAPVSLTVNAVAVEECNGCGCFDTLHFYNGDTTADPLLFAGCRDQDDLCFNNPNCIQAGDVFTSTSADGCLTVQFTTDSSVTYFGWQMTVSVPQVGADLAITKTTDAVGPVLAGDQVTYTIEVTNNGPDAATGVTVTDPLPAEVAYVSNTCSGSHDGGTHTWTWAVGNLANGASASCDLVVQVDGAAEGFVNNTATVAGNEDDPTPANDADSGRFQVLQPTPIPALGTSGAALLALLIATGAILLIRRRFF